MRIAVLFAALGRFQFQVVKPTDLTRVDYLPPPPDLGHHFPYAIVHFRLEPISMPPINLDAEVKGFFEALVPISHRNFGYVGCLSYLFLSLPFTF